MNRNELIDLLNEDTAERAKQRTLANIARRAQTLFNDGYSYTRHADTGNSDLFLVTSPKDDTYGVFVEKEPVFGDTCTCPAFKKFNTCKHLQAIKNLLWQEDADAAQLADYEANRQDADDDRYPEL